MKFYTDPSYFFELWYAEIQKDIEERRKEVKQRKKRVGILLISPSTRIGHTFIVSQIIIWLLVLMFAQMIFLPSE